LAGAEEVSLFLLDTVRPESISHLYRAKPSSKSLRIILPKGAIMLDVVLLTLSLILFVLSIGYAYACDRL
jgi:hypothetical protein